jgi:hypothetical protein
LPASSRQPAYGRLYARLREQLGHAVPLENDGSTCVSEKSESRKIRGTSSPSPDAEHVTISALCRHNARAANDAGKSGTAQVSLKGLFFLARAVLAGLVDAYSLSIHRRGCWCRKWWAWQIQA